MSATPASIGASTIPHTGGGILNARVAPHQLARATLAYLRAMNWRYVTAIVSADDARSRALFDAFESLAESAEICIATIVYASVENRSRPMSSHTRATVFFTTAEHAAEFLSARLRFGIDGAHHVSVMIEEAQNFYLLDPTNALQYAGTVAIRPKDILDDEFKVSKNCFFVAHRHDPCSQSDLPHFSAILPLSRRLRSASRGFGCL